MRFLILGFISLIVISCASSPPTLPQTGPAPIKVIPIKPEASILTLIQKTAVQYQLEPALLLGMIQIESNFRPNARSAAGARGLMQLMPKTAASIARKLGYQHYDIEDPKFNIEAGAFYLASLLQVFNGNLDWALAGYNNGPERISRWLKQGQPFPSGTQKYVATILAARDSFQQQETRGMDQRLVPPSFDEKSNESLDRDGLRILLQEQQQLYGDRPDAPLSETPQP